VLLAFKVLGAEGGLTGLRERLPALLDGAGRPAAEMAPLGAFDWANPAFKGAFMGFAVAVLVQWWSWKYSDGGGVLIQRMNSARSERDSRLGMLWFVVATYAIRPWPWFLVALASLWVFPEMTDHKAVYPAMMAKYLDPGWLGLMLAAMLAAFMSTIDTHMNLASSYFVHDVYRRFWKKDADERHYVAVARLAGVVVVLLGSLVAWQSDSISFLFIFLLQLVAGAGAVFLLRWFWWRINAWSEIAAMASSLVVATLMNLANSGDWFRRQFDAWEIFLWNVGISALVWVSVAFLAPATDEAALRDFVARTRPPGLWSRFSEGVERERSGRSWLGVLGGLGLVYGLLFGLGFLFFGKIGRFAISAYYLVGGIFVLWFALRPPRNPGAEG